MVGIHRRARRAALTPSRILATLLALTPLCAAAQDGDVFASDGARQGRPFSHIPDRNPDCADPVHRYWELTDELQVLDAERKRSVNPEATALTREINDVAHERHGVADEIFDCVRTNSPVLTGGVEDTDFQLSAETNVEEEGPQADDPQPPATGESSTGSQATTIVTGRIVPQQNPAGGGTSPSPGATTSVTGRILPRPNPGGATDPAGDGGTADPAGGDGAADSWVETDVRGEIINTSQLPGNPNQPGTAANAVTHSYAFAQGFLVGIQDAGRETGGRMGQLMGATYYIVTFRPKEAQAMLGIQPGESIVLADLQDKIDEWKEVFTGDPEGTNVMHSYESGRTVAKSLTSFITGKLGGRFRQELGLPHGRTMPLLPEPGSTPPLQPPAGTSR